ncbi:MAG: ZIP family metal transporter [Actinobacteria bacterium]|nr:ZIP family metal transporter [Actinomycetota bacterium]MCB9411879.1 ZIP family metal transporter [Actinomycetota bacterium]
MSATPLAAFALATAAALATMIGWALAASRRTWPPKVFGWAILLAAAAMLLISSLELLPSAISGGLSLPAALGWVVLGAVLVIALHYAADLFDLGGNRLGRSALLVAIAIGLHNVPEGAAPMAAALLSWPAGLVTALAVALHNIPEGIAVSAPVLASGGSRTRAFWFTAVATGGEIAGAALALVFSGVLTETRIAALLALVAGIMMTLSLVELAPSGWSLVRRRAATLDA